MECITLKFSCIMLPAFCICSGSIRGKSLYESGRPHFCYTICDVLITSKCLRNFLIQRYIWIILVKSLCPREISTFHSFIIFYTSKNEAFSLVEKSIFNVSLHKIIYLNHMRCVDMCYLFFITCATIFLVEICANLSWGKTKT